LRSLRRVENASAPGSVAQPTLWPTDKFVIAYSSLMICLLAVASRHDARTLLFAAGHVAIVLFVFGLARSASGIAIFLRHWYLLVYLPLCYKEVPYLVSALGLRVADSTLARWDTMMWKTDPVFGLSASPNPPLVEFLQIVYTLFLPGVLALAIVLWLRRSRQEFRYGALLLAATFLISYLGYLALPARGPRLMPYAAAYPPLHGLWSFAHLQRVLDSLEGTQYDCFPSGHVAVVLVGCYVARKISPLVFYVFSAFAALIAFSTVYLRYHYVIDVITGAVLAIVIVAAAPSIYRKLGDQGSA
jgi:membrane-associated phospholipid phosphatase